MNAVQIPLQVQTQANYLLQLPQRCCFTCFKVSRTDDLGGVLLSYCEQLQGHVHDAAICDHYDAPNGSGRWP